MHDIAVLPVTVVHTQTIGSSGYTIGHVPVHPVGTPAAHVISTAFGLVAIVWIISTVHRWNILVTLEAIGSIAERCIRPSILTFIAAPDMPVNTRPFYIAFRHIKIHTGSALRIFDMHSAINHCATCTAVTWARTGSHTRYAGIDLSAWRAWALSHYRRRAACCQHHQQHDRNYVFPLHLYRSLFCLFSPRRRHTPASQLACISHTMIKYHST